MKGFAQDLQKAVVVPGDENSSFGVSSTIHQGAILPHRKMVSEIVGKATKSLELSFYKNTFGKKAWQQLHNYPRLGISAIVMDLGNEQELGNGYGLFSFIELPSNHHRKISWNMKLGFGLGYIEKPFNRETNYKNVAIGSRFNAIIYANSSWSLRITEAVKFSAGLSVVHFSNASSSRPNLGINIFSLNSGFSYDFGEKEPFLVQKVEKRARKWIRSVRASFGVKEIPPADGPKYFVSAYSFGMMKPRAPKSSFGFSVDLFYNTSLSQAIVDDSSSTSGSIDNVRAGVGGVYAFDFGKISLAVELGGYVFSKYKKQGNIYSRLFTKFNATDKLFFTVGLKTHYFVADFPEFGIGFNFN
ncbi:MAG: acyloxyacyl hydrolase [Vicingaceae bacterium]